MNRASVALLLLAAGLLVASVHRVVRGRAENAWWNAAIAEHHELTGDYPTVADIRAGRLASRDAVPVPGRRTLAGPAPIVTVTATDLPRPARTQGAR